MIYQSTNIFKTQIHFLRVNFTFNDTVNMIHDVITTVNPFPYTAKFMFVGVSNLAIIEFNKPDK